MDLVTAHIVVDLLIGAAVLVLVLFRQLQARPVNDNMRLPLILGIVGVAELVQFLQHRPHGPAVVVALAGSVAIAAIFGAIRAASVRVWVDGGQAWRQGNWLLLQARAQRMAGGSLRDAGGSPPGRGRQPAERWYRHLVAVADRS